MRQKLDDSFIDVTVSQAADDLDNLVRDLSKAFGGFWTDLDAIISAYWDGEAGEEELVYVMNGHAPEGTSFNENEGDWGFWTNETGFGEPEDFEDEDEDEDEDDYDDDVDESDYDPYSGQNTFDDGEDE
jgi:hypothetical protein